MELENKANCLVSELCQFFLVPLEDIDAVHKSLRHSCRSELT